MLVRQFLLVKKIARSGSNNKLLKTNYRLAALHSLISTRAGALPKICRHATKTGELCVVQLGDACIASAKCAIRFCPQRIRCASEGGPQNEASQGLMPYAELHFSWPIQITKIWAPPVS
jgi:hypothetical protein